MFRPFSNVVLLRLMILEDSRLAFSSYVFTFPFHDSRVAFAKTQPPDEGRFLTSASATLDEF